VGIEKQTLLFIWANWVNLYIVRVACAAAVIPAPIIVAQRHSSSFATFVSAIAVFAKTSFFGLSKHYLNWAVTNWLIFCEIILHLLCRHISLIDPY
jgi:hypothetical protein